MYLFNDYIHIISEQGYKYIIYIYIYTDSQTNVCLLDKLLVLSKMARGVQSLRK